LALWFEGDCGSMTKSTFLIALLFSFFEVTISALGDSIFEFGLTKLPGSAKEFSSRENKCFGLPPSLEFSSLDLRLA